MSKILTLRTQSRLNELSRLEKANAIDIANIKKRSRRIRSLRAEIAAIRNPGQPKKIPVVGGGRQ